MSTPALARAFDALEDDLAFAARRLALRSTRRRRRTIAALLVASLLAITGTASGILHVPISPGDDPTANHAASALGLSAEEAAVLLKAQRLGDAVNACMLANGATRVNGGLDDPGRTAATTCRAEYDANESWLDSPEFASAMRSALPAILDAARCFQRHTGVVPGSMLDADGNRPPEAVLAAGSAACFRPDGLPK